MNVEDALGLRLLAVGIGIAPVAVMAPNLTALGIVIVFTVLMAGLPKRE